MGKCACSTAADYVNTARKSAYMVAVGYVESAASAVAKKYHELVDGPNPETAQKEPKEAQTEPEETQTKAEDIQTEAEETQTKSEDIQTETEEIQTATEATQPESEETQTATEATQTEPEETEDPQSSMGAFCKIKDAAESDEDDAVDESAQSEVSLTSSCV